MTADLIILLAIDLFFLVLIANTALYFTHFWQLKEYRLDRMVDFLRTATGKKRLRNWLFWFKAVLLTVLMVMYATFYLNALVSGVPKSGFVASVWAYLLPLVIVLAGVEMVEILLRVFRHRFYRPEFTLKAYLIVFLTLLLAVIWPLYHWQNLQTPARSLSTTWSVIYLLTPLLNALVILVFFPITKASKAVILKMARRKISHIKELKIIAITGSYGKSSTKEFLSHLLSTKFKVLKTPGNTNTEIGVARIILKNLAPRHNVFIVEAGAYKTGEIKKIADMIVPQIAIITAVKDSHLSLFGSLENIKRGKFELVQGLDKNGIAIFNADNEGAMDLANRAKRLKLGKIIHFGLGTGSQLTAENIMEDTSGVRFTIENVKFDIPVPGKHNVYNFLAAAAAARELGLSLEEMAELAKSIKLREHTLSIFKPKDSLVLLDDTYNANPDGVMAALDYLSLYKDWRKVIVFPSMLELGERADKEHARITKHITEICDEAVFISEDYRHIIEGTLQEYHYEDYQYIIGNPQRVQRYLEIQTAKRKAVILFISRGCEQVLTALKNAT